MISNNFYYKIKNFLQIKENKIHVSNNILSKNVNDKFKLIRTHKNNVKLLYLTDKKIFRKYSKSIQGIEKIVSEYQGLIWYCNKIKQNKSSIISHFFKKKKFAFIDLKEVKGYKAKSWKPIEANFSFLLKAYKHYMNYYPKKGTSKIHGDFTLENIIFKSKGLFIIDWEFFKSKENYRGYDIVYLFLSSACLPYILNRTFSKKDEVLFCKLWKILIKENFNKKMILSPFEFFENNIKTDKVLRKSYKLSKSKFFPFITSKIHKDKILKIIKHIYYGK